MEIQSLLEILRESLSPFVFISAIGLMVLSMSNRLPRPIDRVRELCQELETAPQEDLPFLIKEIKQLRLRAGILRTAIGLAVASILGVSVSVMILFAGLVFEIPHFYSVPILFTASMVCLMLSLLAFMWDIKLTLTSVGIEVERQIRKIGQRV